MKLKTLFICPSHECNADCVHCYEKYNNKENQSLATAQVKDIIDQFNGLNGRDVIFCSGEFLLREDALGLVQYANLKTQGVSIVTNGLLADEAKIQELKEAGLTRLIVSIDSADSIRHDTLRGYRGCFEKAVNAIKFAVKLGIYADIWTYVTKTHFNELDGILELSRKIKVREVFVFFPLLSGHLFNRFEENLTYEDREKFRNKFNGQQPIRLEFVSESGSCRGGGAEHVCVMPSGDVTFCPPVPYSYGNINQRSLRDCLKDIREDYQRFSHCRGQCIVNFLEYREKNKARFMY